MLWLSRTEVGSSATEWNHRFNGAQTWNLIRHTVRSSIVLFAIAREGFVYEAVKSLCFVAGLEMEGSPAKFSAAAGSGSVPVDCPQDFIR